MTDKIYHDNRWFYTGNHIDGKNIDSPEYDELLGILGIVKNDEFGLVLDEELYSKFHDLTTGESLKINGMIVTCIENHRYKKDAFGYRINRVYKVTSAE